ncbi:hypothetical protein FFI16_015480 [Pseudomonas sp. KBS0710]|uniref:hypothetical protein n=1 Tax=Pseudomonas sp. KBS0710 TaxID=1179667 RepID=UPI00110D406D|nr:hypothetical protein [Pseudomonas sp. KBS0710]TSD77760.1 hypothetical protein FFI16_015480 [Pseudomonas sp. KBS0710]
MKTLFIAALSGLILCVAMTAQASDGAEALARWQQQFKQEQAQKRRAERDAAEHKANSEEPPPSSASGR